MADRDLTDRQGDGEAAAAAARIAAALTAYACGDALGVPWEGQPPHDHGDQDLEALPQASGWAAGATSDDTALTLLVAEHLVAREGAGQAAELLAAMAAADPPIPGIGPSTRRALARFRSSGDLPSEGGGTNGAVMRSLPVGWALAPGAGRRRRELSVEMSRATHPDPQAQVAACVTAACAAWSLEGAGPRTLLETAVEEETAAAALLGVSTDLAGLLASVAAGDWRPLPTGVSLDACDTTAAVLDCVVRAASLRDGLLRAVRLGGDTDTVAALVGGLLAARHDPAQVRRELPWHAGVRLPGEATIQRLASGLAGLRTASASAA